MPVESPPFATAVGSFPAEQTRRAVLAWAARTSANTPGLITGGLLSSTDCQLSAPGSGMSVNVSPGEIIVGGSEGGTQGGYGPCRVTGTTNLTIATANASNPRIDTICATVSDAGYTEPTGGSGSGWALQVVTGTAVAGATLANLSGAAALPASSLLLGYVLVPAGASSIVAADISNIAQPVNFGRDSGWVSQTAYSQLTTLSPPAFQVRVRNNVATLRGFMYNSSGSAISAGSGIFTLTTGLPSYYATILAVNTTSWTVIPISVQTGGGCFTEVAIPANNYLYFNQNYDLS